ncbi:hypothetical protein MTO96_002073 [Rhipicephalus appendiculatus]
MALLASQDLFATVAAWCGTWPVIFAVVAITLGGLLTVKGLPNSARQKRKRLPPGPKGLPLLGYLPFIWKPYHAAFREISEKYGPIIRLQLGIKDVVVLNDVATIREALSNPDLLYRPDDFMFTYLGVKGIAGINGEAWLVNRRYCVHVLRDLGFAKKSMEEHIRPATPRECRARVQQEIDSVVGRQRTPAWEDRVNMPYTMASILETMRWRTPTPLSLHRARACPGETLALIEVFLYLTTVLQKFKVLPEEGKMLCLDGEHGLHSVVDDAQPLRFIPR